MEELFDNTKLISKKLIIEATELREMMQRDRCDNAFYGFNKEELDYLDLECEEHNMIDKNKFMHFYKFNNSTINDFRYKFIYYDGFGKPNFSVIPSLKCLQVNLNKLLDAFGSVISGLQNHKGTPCVSNNLIKESINAYKNTFINIQSLKRERYDKYHKDVEMMKALTYNPVKEDLARSIEDSRKRISTLILQKGSEVEIRRELDEIEKLKEKYELE